MSNITSLFKLTAVLWVIWGLVHVLAGFMIISSPAHEAVGNVADAMNAAELASSYHPAVGALLNQHGFNLTWVGLVTTISAFFIWKRNSFALFLAAVVGGLTDVGYFVFMDLGGFVNFVPGTVMTIISALAIVLSIVIFKVSATPDN